MVGWKVFSGNTEKSSLRIMCFYYYILKKKEKRKSTLNASLYFYFTRSTWPINVENPPQREKSASFKFIAGAHPSEWNEQATSHSLISQPLYLWASLLYSTVTDGTRTKGEGPRLLMRIINTFQLIKTSHWSLSYRFAGSGGVWLVTIAQCGWDSGRGTLIEQQPSPVLF